MSKKSKTLNDEIKKWTASTDDILSRMDLMIKELKKDLKDNQDLFNKEIHKEDFDCTIAVAYIHAMNNIINSIQSISNLKLKPSTHNDK